MLRARRRITRRHDPADTQATWLARCLKLRFIPRRPLTVIACPDCGVPAEVTKRFSLPGTAGPDPHVALNCAAGHQVRMAVDRLPAQAQEQLAGRKTRRKPRTAHHLCIHCMTNPAGFWVSRHDSKVVRRPWCLSCCQELDPDLCDIVPFGA